MASKCSRMICRATKSFARSVPKSTSQTAFKDKSSFSKFSIPSKSTSSPLSRFSLSRSPSELGAVMSLLPLHSAVAAARMTSCLSPASRSCRALSQELGLSVPR